MITPNRKQRLSKVTNGRKHFVGAADGRTSEGRRYNDLHAEIISAMGDDRNPGFFNQQMVRRMTALLYLAEIEESKMLAGDRSFSADKLIRASGLIGRYADRLGLEMDGDGKLRKRDNDIPDLMQHIAAFAAERDGKAGKRDRVFLEGFDEDEFDD
jgi:hypothetical protein